MQRSVPPLVRRLPGANAFTRHIIILLTLVILLLGSALGGRLLGVFAQSPCAKGDASYSVRFGDTLSAIAMRYRTTWPRLASYNHIANANLIFPGQQVCIPGKASRGGTGGSGSPGGSRQDFVSLARQDALNVGFSPNVFVRQINQESGFNPSAISPAGALGIAQFEPATAASLGVNPWDPVQSLQGASRLMASYIRQFGGAGDDHPLPGFGYPQNELLLFCHNSGIMTGQIW